MARKNNTASNNRVPNNRVQNIASALLCIIDKMINTTHQTTNWEMLGLVAANITMYAMLFLVACDKCGFTLDSGVLTALVAGTLTISTPYYVRIALGKRGKPTT